MAVTLTVDDLALALRLSDGVTALDAPTAAIVGRLLGASSAMVMEYAEAAPDIVHDEAAIRASGWLFDNDGARNRRFSDVLAFSGAQSILSMFRISRALSLDGETGAAAVVGGGGDGLNAAQVNALIAFALADYATTGQLAGHAGLPNVHHIPPEIMEGGDVVAGISAEAALAQIKAFARTGVTTPPLPADLAPDPMSGRVLGLRTAGGQLETSWNQLSAGSPHFVLDTIPTPEQQAIGGILPQGGVVLVRESTNHPTQLWVRISPAFALVLFHTFGDPLVRPDAMGQLPSAADYIGRLALAGNQLLISVGEHGTDKMVGFANYGPTRPEPPVRTAQEIIYAGSFASPPTGNYVTGAVAWDYGSEVWLQNQTNDDDDWASYSGPLGYHHGNLYLSDADAAVHVPNDSYVGRVYVIGHGSGQRPRVVTNFVAPTAPTSEWIPLGIQLSDVTAIVNAHNMAATAHAARFATIEEGYEAADATLLAGYTAGDATLTAAIAALQAVSGLTILPYSATASHELGGSNTFVVHSDQLLAYIHDATLSANHDPAQHPNYWANLSTLVNIINVNDSTNTHFRRGHVILTHEDEVYLCTTNAQAATARNLSYVKANSGAGGEFVQVVFAEIPRDRLPGVREWTLNAEYKKGEIVDTTGGAHRHYIANVDNNSSNISNRKQPGTPDGVGTWQQIFTSDNPPPAPMGGGLTPVKVYTSNGTINTGVQFYEETLDPAAYYQILLKNDRGLTPLVSGKFMEGLPVNDPVYVRGWLRGSVTSYLEFEVEYDGTNIEFIYFGPNNTNFQTNLEVWRYT